MGKFLTHVIEPAAKRLVSKTMQRRFESCMTCQSSTATRRLATGEETHSDSMPYEKIRGVRLQSHNRVD